METDKYYQEKEETLRKKYVRNGIERAKREEETLRKKYVRNGIERAKREEETLRKKYVRNGIERAKREVAIQKEIDKLFMTKNELLEFLDKLIKPQK